MPEDGAEHLEDTEARRHQQSDPQVLAGRLRGRPRGTGPCPGPPPGSPPRRSGRPGSPSPVRQPRTMASRTSVGSRSVAAASPPATPPSFRSCRDRKIWNGGVQPPPAPPTGSGRSRAAGEEGASGRHSRSRRRRAARREPRRPGRRRALQARCRRDRRPVTGRRDSSGVSGSMPVDHRAFGGRRSIGDDPGRSLTRPLGAGGIPDGGRGRRACDHPTMSERAPLLAARLTRRRDGRWLAGVCNGLAAALGVQVGALRAVVVLLSLGSLPAVVLLYALAWVFLPPEGEEATVRPPAAASPSAADRPTWSTPPPSSPSWPGRSCCSASSPPGCPATVVAPAVLAIVGAGVAWGWGGRGGAPAPGWALGTDPAPVRGRRRQPRHPRRASPRWPPSATSAPSAAAPPAPPS